MRLTPTIATSGWLMTGVAAMPPRAPRLVTVIVEPVSSSRAALPARARRGQPAHFGRASPQVERLGVAHHRHHQPGFGLRRDADMHGGVAVQDAGLVVVAGVDCGCSRERLDHRPHQERQQGQLLAVGPILVLSSARSSSSAVTSISST